MEKSFKNENELQDKIQKGVAFLLKLSKEQRNKLLMILKQVQIIQKSNLSSDEKKKEIKKVLWSSRSVRGKLLIGGFLGTMTGIMIFGTQGVGIAAFGSAVGVWGWLAGTAGGVLVSSLIQNFERNKDNKAK